MLSVQRTWRLVRRDDAGSLKSGLDFSKPHLEVLDDVEECDGLLRGRKAKRRGTRDCRDCVIRRALGIRWRNRGELRSQCGALSAINLKCTARFNIDSSAGRQN